MKSKLISALLPVVMVLGGCSVVSAPQSGSTSNAVQQTANQQVTPYDLDLYADVLNNYVDEQGWVDYEGLQADRAALDQFNASLDAVSMETYESWTEPEQIAFLVNAYNSLTLKSIIDQQPLKSSIRDIPGVWRIRKHPILGNTKTLDAIEHSILRKDFNEPRIHAALVCAALSCPPLRNEPYTGENLDDQLDDQVVQWLEGEHGIAIDQANKTVAISSIFEWFGEDWKPSFGTDDGFTGSANQKAVLNFISNYLSDEEAAYLESGDYKLNYLYYDWALNRQS